MEDAIAINYWTTRYTYHLLHWLIKKGESNENEQLNIRYRQLKDEPNQVFAGLCEFLGIIYDAGRFDKIYKATDKIMVKSLTKHDQGVVKLSDEYQAKKKMFKKNNSKLIHNTMKCCVEQCGMSYEELMKYF